MDDYGPSPDEEDGEDGDWPPFKKVGNFDPFADDPRFVIQKLLLCPVTRVLLVGGSGGQVMIYNLETNSRDSTEVCFHFSLFFFYNLCENFLKFGKTCVQRTIDVLS